MTKPMPSPRGTNRSGLYLSGKVEAAYDAALPDRDANGAMVDSGLANRIVAACFGTLEDGDFKKLVAMLKDADLITDEEADTLSSQLQGSGEVSDPGAMDSRMAMDAQSHVARVMRHRMTQYRNHMRSYNSLFDAISPPSPQTDPEDFFKRFPGAQNTHLK